MGVPGLFGWLRKKYPLIVRTATETESSHGDDKCVCDNLYIGMFSMRLIKLRMNGIGSRARPSRHLRLPIKLASAAIQHLGICNILLDLFSHVSMQNCRHEPYHSRLHTPELALHALPERGGDVSRHADLSRSPLQHSQVRPGASPVSLQDVLAKAFVKHDFRMIEHADFNRTVTSLRILFHEHL